MVKKIIIACLLFLSIFLSFCVQNEGDKLKLFYKYDEMLNVKIEHSLGLEKGSEKEIFRLDDVSADYQYEAEEYLKFLSKVIDKNIATIDSFFKLIEVDELYSWPKLFLTDDGIKAYPKTYEYYTKINKILYNEILLKYPNCVRVMYNVEKFQFILIGRDIDDKTTATVAGWPSVSLNFWSNYYFGYLNYRYLNDNGEMKYDYWFYETNLKLRVVKQIRNINGKYIGELAIDFYKFKDYDKLFNNKT